MSGKETQDVLHITRGSRALALVEKMPACDTPYNGTSVTGCATKNPRERVAGILHLSRRIYFSTISVNG
jgi:hypothetical protein